MATKPVSGNRALGDAHRDISDQTKPTIRPKFAESDSRRATRQSILYIMRENRPERDVKREDHLTVVR